MTSLPIPVAALRGQQAYRVVRHPAPVDLLLDGNEGLAPEQELLTHLIEAGPEIARRYPTYTGLVARTAERFGVSSEQVIVTAGGDDAIDRCCRAFLAPGRELIMPTPTFEMVGRYARLAGATVRSVPWPGGPFPLETVLSLVRPETSMISFVSPNNPTGAVGTADDLRRLSEAAPQALLLVDHAYVEFADHDLTAVALSLPNAIVLRTMSKAWGLAGLRVGFAMGSAELIECLRVAGQPYAVSGPSLVLATAKLKAGDGAVTSYVARVREERSALESLLSDLGAAPQPSQGNFVFARSAQTAWLRDGLAGMGIAVRIWSGHPELDGCLRISCPGSAPDFDRLTHGLRAVVAPQALLLDMDGVLADVSQSYRQAISSTAMRWNVELTQEQISDAKAKGNANNDWVLTHVLLAEHGVEVPFDEVKATFERVYQGTSAEPGLWRKESLIPPRALLERLAARTPLGLVTGRPRADADRFLDAHELGDLFRAKVCMEDGPLKPDPAPVRLALEQLGVERAWMVGDTCDDITAARGAHVVPLAVIAPGEDRDKAARALLSSGAARVLDNLPALEEMLP